MPEPKTIARYTRMGLCADLEGELRQALAHTEVLAKQACHESPALCERTVLSLAERIGRSSKLLRELTRIMPVDFEPGFVDDFANAMTRGNRHDHG